MELTPTLILNLALLIVPPVALVLVFRQWLARHIRVPHLLQTKKVKYSLITTLVNIPELIRRGVFCGIKLDGILADEIGTSC